MIQVISDSHVIDESNDELIQLAIPEGFLDDEHVGFDASHFESRDAPKPTEKKEPKATATCIEDVKKILFLYTG